MSIESNLLDWWKSSSVVTGLVTGGLWRDDAPELNTDDTTVEMPYARLSVLAETPAAVLTRTPGESREYLEEQLLQVDIFANDPSVAKKAMTAARDLLDRWETTFEYPDIFIGIDRTNAALLKDPNEEDGENVWHVVLEYLLTVQRETNG